MIIGKREDLYQSSDQSEVDEAYYSTKYIFEENEFTVQKETLKSGNGSQNKTSFLVMDSQKSNSKKKQRI